MATTGNSSMRSMPSTLASVAVLGALLAALLGFAPAAFAASGSITVGAEGDYPTLAEAVNAIDAGAEATVTLLADTEESTAAVVPAGAKVTIDLAGHSVSGKPMEDLPDWKQGLTEYKMSLVVAAGEGTELVLKNGTIQDSNTCGRTNYNSAGAVFVKEGATATIEDVTFKDNKDTSSSGYATSVYALNSTLAIDGCTFDNAELRDTANSAVYAEKVQLSIKGSTFTHQYMCAYTIDCDGATIDNCQFVDNTEGTSVYGYYYIVPSVSGVVEQTTTFTNCTFSNNVLTSNGRGGVVTLNNPIAQVGSNNYGTHNNNVFFKSCTFTNNASRGKEEFQTTSIIKLDYKTTANKTCVTLQDTLVANNTVQRAAIDVDAAGYLTLVGSTVRDNYCLGLETYDGATGGIYFAGKELSIDEGSAVYHNSLEYVGNYSQAKANDIFINGHVSWNSVSIPAAKSMTDQFASFDFSGYVWNDGKTTGYEEGAPTVNKSESYYFTAMPEEEVYVAKIGETYYKSLEEAFDNATAGDTIEIVTDAQIVDVATAITADKNVTLALNDHNVRWHPRAEQTGPLFTVKSGTTLTFTNEQSTSTNNKVDGGIASGELLIEDGGHVVMDDAMLTQKITDNGQLVVNALQEKLDVALGAGKVITLGSAYDGTTKSDGTIAVALDSSVLAALNAGTTKQVVVADGGNAAFLPAIDVSGLGGSVLKEFTGGKVVLRHANAVCLSSAGSDSNSGATANEAVATFDRAKELVAAGTDVEAVIVCGEVVVADSQAWSLDVPLLRDTGYRGHLVRVANGGSLELGGVTLSGRSLEADAALVKVDSGGTLAIAEGAVLTANRNKKPNGYRYGGGVYSEGTTTMTGGTIEGNEAGLGGGVAAVGGTFTMTGGAITGNVASQDYYADGDPAREEVGAGGGVFLAGGAQMNFGKAAAQSGARLLAASTADNGPSITYNTSYGPGGGISLGALQGSRMWYVGSENGVAYSKGTRLNMTGGLIDHNTANGSGGGIFVQDSMSAYVYAGDITNNVALGTNGYFAGGGIYVNGIHSLKNPDTDEYYGSVSSALLQSECDLEHGFLYLESVEIADNTAEWLGGALATCNVSKTIVGDLSTAIHDNTANNNGIGSSVAAQGTNTDVFLSTVSHYNWGLNGSDTHPLAYLSNYMIGGGTYTWSDTDTGSALDNGALYYQLRPLLAYVSEADAADMATAVDGAKVRITGNYGGTNGGGLGSDGIIVLGSIAPKIDVAVEKAWDGDNEAIRPVAVKLDLYRAAEGGAPVLVDSAIVEADEDGTYAHTWDDLLRDDPATGAAYAYTVAEDLSYAAYDAQGNAVDLTQRYTSAAEAGDNTSRQRQVTRANAEGGVDTIDQPIENWTVTNTFVPEPNEAVLPVHKVVTGNLAPQAEFTFELTADKASYPLPEGTEGAVATATVVGTGTTEFAPIHFEAPGTYTYTVVERDEGLAGFTYDKTEYTVTYDVSMGSDGKLDIDCEVKEGETPVAEVAFANVYHAQAATAAGIEVSKAISGDTPTHMPTFDFVLEPKDDANPMPEEAEGPAQVVSVTGAGSASFGQITFHEPGTYAYVVYEADTKAAGWTYDQALYTVTYEVTHDQAAGKLVATPTIERVATPGAPAEDASAVAFENAYEHTPNTADGIVVRKHVTGDSPEHAQEFYFVLAPDNAANPLPGGADAAEVAVSTHGAEVAAFDPIHFDAPGTYAYTVAERKGSATGYSYDTATYRVVYVVTAGADELDIATSIESDGAVFEGEELSFANAFAHTPVSVEIPVTKVVSGDPVPSDETFTFVLAAENDDTPLPTSTEASVVGAGTATYAPITFDAPGTYRYTVTEQLGNAEGYTYDNAVHEVTVVVEEQGGVLMASVDYLRDGEEADQALFDNAYEEPPVPEEPTPEQDEPADTPSEETDEPSTDLEPTGDSEPVVVPEPQPEPEPSYEPTAEEVPTPSAEVSVQTPAGNTVVVTRKSDGAEVDRWTSTGEPHVIDLPEGEYRIVVTDADGNETEELILIDADGKVYVNNGGQWVEEADGIVELAPSPQAEASAVEEQKQDAVKQSNTPKTPTSTTTPKATSTTTPQASTATPASTASPSAAATTVKTGDEAPASALALAGLAAACALFAATWRLRRSRKG